jgi:hypothetical protein
MNNTLNTSDVELDELDKLRPIPATAKPGAAAATPAAAANTNPNIQSWDADDPDDVSGSILKNLGVPYIKVAENQPARIAFIPGGKIVGAPVHYDSRSSHYYLCDAKSGQPGKCCTRLGDAKGRAAGFVFRYTNADPKTGKLAPNVKPEVDVGIFTMSRSNWDDVKGAVEEGSSVYAADYRISVSEKQLTRKVAVIARVARWREIEAEALALAAPFVANPKQLERALGRAYTTEAADPEARLGDVESL